MTTKKTPYLFLAPLFISLTVFLFFSLSYLLYLSVTNSYWLSEKIEFVGLKNYFNFITNPFFIQVSCNTLLFIIISNIIQLLIGLGVALCLNENFFGQGIFRSLIIIPWCIPLPVSALIFTMMLHGVFGPVNQILTLIGIINKPLLWFAYDNTAFVALVLIWTWINTPWFIIFSLAALQAVPPEIYESAKIDGTSTFQRFTYITLPLIKSPLLIATMFSVISTFNKADLIFILTRGGPDHSTEILTLTAYMKAFSQLLFGEASAVTVFCLLIAGIFTLFFIKITKVTE